MNTRDALADFLERAYDLNEGMVTFELLAHAILTDGYRKPYTVNTVEELDALPTGAVVRDIEGMVFEKDHNATHPDDTTWWLETGSSRDYQSSSITLPAAVIYEGEE